MLNAITFIEDYRCFKQGTAIPFRPGVNLLVGEQGTGKSTLLDLLSGRDRETRRILSIDGEGTCASFDFEKDDLRTKDLEYAPKGTLGMHIQSRWKSHGRPTSRC